MKQILQKVLVECEYSRSDSELFRLSPYHPAIKKSSAGLDHSNGIALISFKKFPTGEGLGSDFWE